MKRYKNWLITNAIDGFVGIKPTIINTDAIDQVTRDRDGRALITTGRFVIGVTDTYDDVLEALGIIVNLP